jgi:hydroxymethylpyrimidine/phosphomethylpyrimidine kinase
MAQDFKVLAALGVHACGAPAALTAQGRGGVAQIQGVAAALLRQQLATLLKEEPVAAIKLGLLYSAAQVDAVAEILRGSRLPIVLDPVLGASAGGSLVTEDYLPALKQHLLPLCTLLTPNLREAGQLAGLAPVQRKADLPKPAYALLKLGAQAVLLKGGHLEGGESPDFYLDQAQEAWLEARRVETANSRGTGCALASAIAAGLAKGLRPLEACRQAKDFVSKALQISAQDTWPQGEGPLRFQ